MLALLVVSPAFGGPSLASIAKTAKQAQKTSKGAAKSAKSAKGLASSALATAATADGKADQALARPVVTPGGITRVVGPENTYVPVSIGSSIALCPGGQKVISGGGAVLTGVGDGIAVSDATADRTGWFVLGANNDDTDATIQAVAYCAPGGGAVAATAVRARARAQVARVAAALESRLKANR